MSSYHYTNSPLKVLLMKDLLQPPTSFPADTVFPPKLIPGPTPQAWEIQRDEIRRRWLGYLGTPPERCELQVQTLSEDVLEQCRRLHLRYQVERDIWCEAFLVIPFERAHPAPGVVVFHPTTADTIREPAGLAGRTSRHHALQLAAQGYVTLCPENYLWHYRGDRVTGDQNAWERLQELTDRLLVDHPGWTGMGKMLWDAQRAVDLLAGRPEVDAKRLGCMGMSLGGKEALYLPAFDERITASVSMDGGIGMSYTNWDADWYLGSQVHRSEFVGDHHEVLSLIAPRAFCLVGSTGGLHEETGEWVEGYDGERSWPYVAAALPVWELYGKPERLAILSHQHGHSVPSVARELMVEWFGRAFRSNA